MKRSICFVLVLVTLLSCLTGCNFTQNMSGALAGVAESTSKVKEMMTALAENRAPDAKALLHPQATEKADAAIAQMSDYLSGREVSSIEQKNININTFTGTSGKTKQEKVVYQATLTDGAVIYINVVYLSTNSGTGFSSFQLVLGVV